VCARERTRRQGVSVRPPLLALRVPSHFLYVCLLLVVVAIEISIPVVVPGMVMFKPAAVPVPVTAIVAAPIMTRNYPMGAWIGRARPITFMPHIAPSDGIPIAVYPRELRAWPRRQNMNHARRRWRANDDGDLSKQRSTGQQQHRNQSCSNKCFHELNPLPSTDQA